MEPTLEALTSDQCRVANTLLLLAAATAAERGDSPELRALRREQARELGAKLDFEVPAASTPLKPLVEAWWRGEQPRLSGTQGVAADEVSWRALSEEISYRLLALFGRNLTMCPFTRTPRRTFGQAKPVSDAQDFEEIIGDQFREFCLASAETLNHPTLAYAVRTISEDRLEQTIRSARYRLAQKDLALIKAALVGVSAGITAAFVVGPVIGTKIGEAAGLYGAAATAHGLAILGGGSLASGGFGMAGGSAVIGVLCGGAKGSFAISKELDTELLELTVALQKLPVALAIGHGLRRIGATELLHKIFKDIAAREREMDDREAELSLTGQPDARIKQVRATRALYSDAKEIAKTFDWVSGYDVVVEGTELAKVGASFLRDRFARIAEGLLIRKGRGDA